MMKRILMLGCTLMTTAVVAGAFEGVETMRRNAAGVFDRLAGLQARFESRLQIRQGAEDANAPTGAEVKATQPIRLSGHLMLQGSAFVNQPHGAVMVTLSGSTQLHNDHGTPLSGMVHFYETQTFFVNGNFISGYVYPGTYVGIYRNGQRIGTVRVAGTIYVSGFVNGNWVNLSGSGQVSGQGTIQVP